MARKDEILRSFLTHEMFEKKYQYSKKELPSTIIEALKSDKPIVKAIAIIIDGLEATPAVTDNVLRNQVTQFLNETL